jgi:hypothetical protein
MVTIETIATVTEDGLITAKASGAVPRGRHRAVIVLEDIPLDKKPENQQDFPDMAAFREHLKVPTSPLLRGGLGFASATSIHART